MKPLVHLKPRTVKVLPVRVNAETPIPASVLLTASFDGACNPNPGPMGVGYEITLNREDKEKAQGTKSLVRVGAPIGQGTNNEAEWHALIALMRHALRLGFWNLAVTTDSQLVEQQFYSRWKAKGRLARLRDEAINLERLFYIFSLRHVYREQNAVADKLSRELTFDEPSLPSIPVDSNSSRKPRALLDWQAAAIRVWSLRHHPGAGTLSRIFGIATPAIEAIANGKAYRNADFSNYGAWIHSLANRQDAEAQADLDSGEFVNLHTDEMIAARAAKRPKCLYCGEYLVCDEREINCIHPGNQSCLAQINNSPSSPEAADSQIL